MSELSDISPTSKMSPKSKGSFKKLDTLITVNDIAGNADITLSN